MALNVGAAEELSNYNLLENKIPPDVKNQLYQEYSSSYTTILTSSPTITYVAEPVNNQWRHTFTVSNTGPDNIWFILIEAPNINLPDWPGWLHYDFGWSWAYYPTVGSGSIGIWDDEYWWGSGSFSNLIGPDGIQSLEISFVNDFTPKPTTILMYDTANFPSNKYGDYITQNVIPTIIGEEKPDFTISEVKPVQVVWNSDINGDSKVDLVAGKSTMVRYNIGYKNLKDLTGQEQLDIQISFDGEDYIISKTIDEWFQGEYWVENDYFWVNIDYYPEASPTKIGDQTITAEVDPGNKIEESDETNNENSNEVTVKDTNELYLVYFPVDRPITYFGYGPIDMEEYSGTVENSGKFMVASYPIAEGEFTNQKKDNKYYGDPIPRLGMLDDAISIWTWGELLTGTSADRSVGIVPDDYFKYHLAGDAAGVTFPGVHAGLVEGGYWTVTAHEIGHTYGLRLKWPFGPGEEYDTNPPGNPSNGFWVSEHKEISNGVCFMGYAPPKHSFDYSSTRPSWICNEDYIDLFKKFRVSETDPDVLLLSGIIFKNGTVKLHSSYFVESGIADDIIQGDYSIQILDADGQTLNEIKFYAPFEMYIETIGVVETDFTGFTFAIPYPKDAAIIFLKYEDEILMEFNPNTKLLHDAIDSIPDYGFADNSEQRRNALHNKIDAVENMLEENNIEEAKEKLEYDIKDKIEKWLLDEYQKEQPTQLSKDEMMNLIDEMLYRLS